MLAIASILTYAKEVLANTLVYIERLKNHHLIRINRARGSYFDLINMLGEAMGRNRPTEGAKGQQQDFHNTYMFLKSVSLYIDYLIKQESNARVLPFRLARKKAITGRSSRAVSFTRTATNFGTDAKPANIEKKADDLSCENISLKGCENDEDGAKIGKDHHSSLSGSQEHDDGIKNTAKDIADHSAQSNPVQKVLDKIEAWADDWLAGKLKDDDWDRLGNCLEN